MELDEMYGPRPWACGECKKILGVVMRDVKRVRRLYVFRDVRSAETMPDKRAMLSLPRGMFVVLGLDWASSGVECPGCGARTPWDMSTLMQNNSRVQQAVEKHIEGQIDQVTEV